ncbi:carboxypeptidase regulatory-like domain-containing protein, partial [Singulisphaera rosea]
PAGYWAPRDLDPIESFAVSDSAPVFRKDYVLRPGTVWNFRIHRDNQPEPFRGVVLGYSEAGQFRGTTDDSDRIHLTLPTEKGKVTAIVGEELTEEMGRVQVLLEWEAGFRTDSVKSVEELAPTSAQYRLTDTEGKTATLSKPKKGRVRPVVDGGKLTIRAELPAHDPSTVGDLVGQVVDTSGKPIDGARIALIWGSENGGSMMSSDARHSATTDAQGRFRLRSILRTTATGKTPAILLAVTKEGFAGVDTPQVPFKPPSANEPHIVGPIKLAPGITVKGTVVDLEGKPLPGAWVEPGGSYASRSQFTKTDAKGQFTVRDLAVGMVSFHFSYGKLVAGGKYLVFRDSGPLSIKLHPIPAPTPKTAEETAATRPRLKSLPLGSMAPDWDTKSWSDGRPRALADYRGKVVFLDFWGVWCRPCVKALPALETVRAKYEARGVVFLTIHTPAEDETTIRKILELNHASLVFALDRNRKGEGIGDEFDGATAERYGVRPYPTAMIIDREGKVAFKTNDPSIVPATQAAMKDLGLDEKTIDEEKMGRIVVRLYEQALERVLDAPSR